MIFESRHNLTNSSDLAPRIRSSRYQCSTADPSPHSDEEPDYQLRKSIGGLTTSNIELSPLCGGQLRYLSIHLSAGRGPRHHTRELVREHVAMGSSLHPGYSNPLPRESAREAAFATDRRVVKLEIRDNRASIVIEQAGGYVASEVIVVLRYESAARSVGGIERRP
jgi:hypothetical protein